MSQKPRCRPNTSRVHWFRPRPHSICNESVTTDFSQSKLKNIQIKISVAQNSYRCQPPCITLQFFSTVKLCFSLINSFERLTAHHLIEMLKSKPMLYHSPKHANIIVLNFVAESSKFKFVFSSISFGRLTAYHLIIQKTFK